VLPKAADVAGLIELGTAGMAFTVIVVFADVAGEPVGQVIFEVRIHVTTSVLLNDDDV